MSSTRLTPALRRPVKLSHARASRLPNASPRRAPDAARRRRETPDRRTGATGRGREAIQSRERERGEIRAQLDHLEGLTWFTAAVDPSALRDDLSARLIIWQGLLERQPIQARQILRKLLQGRLIFERFEDERGRGYKIRWQATYGRLPSVFIRMVPPG